MTDKTVKNKIGDRFSSDSVPARIRALRKRLKIDQTIMAEHLGVSQGTVSGWESGEFPPSAMALMAIGRLDYDNADWWYEKAGPKFAERLKLTRVIQKVRAENVRPAESKRPTQRKLDRKLLAFAIDAVNEELKKAGRDPQNPAYAELIALIYDVCHTSGNRNREMVETLFDVARNAVHLMEPGIRSDAPRKTVHSEEDRNYHGQHGTQKK